MSPPPLVEPVTPFFRARWVLRLTRDVRLHPHHGAVVYALLANANQGPGDPPSFPDGLLLDVPDQGRVVLRAGEPLAFGGTLIECSRPAAARRLLALGRGLARLGRRAARPGDLLGGNFDLEAAEDLVAGSRLDGSSGPTPVPASQLDAELARVMPHDVLNVHFTAPLGSNGRRLPARPVPASSTGPGSTPGCMSAGS
jgi:hypothetical protein